MSGSGGYVGRYLRVDLSSGAFAAAETPLDLCTRFLGGNGFGVKLLWDEVSPAVDPLSPESVLILATGPLCGTAWPTSGRLEAIAKSPLTGIYGDANCGGTFGPALKRSGYDFLVLTGRAERPVWLWIDDGRARLEDATGLWGLDTVETEAAIRRAKEDDRVNVACVGPAAENGVRYASIQASPNRSLARTGVGTVMGAKRLKAIAVRGSRPVPLAAPAEFARLARAMHERIRSNEFYPALARHGTSGLVPVVNEIGRFPTRNFQSGDFAAADRIGGAALRRDHWVKDTGCFGCPICCDKVYQVTSGEFAGAVTSSVEYETLNAFGAAVGVDNLPSVLHANERCDRLGMDTISAGRSISFAFELYEKGLLTTADTDGLELRWGDYRVVLELIERIARREGLGDLLALGVREAARRLGRGADAYAMEVKGLEIPAQDGRAQQS
ncbi:MAG: aldehyde ferredoxin oxidoreductase family protein, partial [Candidatus Bipolaricaulis sp.]|nr:aldehyde ferredoxin oxidoreductase family protein [Candidatus Bipolaricaulis sp.]